MKIAIISDIHDNIHNLVMVLKKIENDNDIERIIFLGDFMNNGIAKILARFKTPVNAIWGNNDGDRCSILKTSLDKKSNMKINNNIYDFLCIEGRNIFITHYDNLAYPMAKSGVYDAVFYGHNHKQSKERVGGCLLVNPGEISGHKTNIVSFAVYDTNLNDAEIIYIDNPVLVNTKESTNYTSILGAKFEK